MTARLLVAVTSAEEAAFVTAIGASRELAVARRCADVADLLAAAAAGVGTHAVLSPDLPQLERDVIDRLRRDRCAVLGLVRADDEAGERLLRQLGVDTVVGAGAALAEVEQAVLSAGGARDALDLDLRGAEWPDSAGVEKGAVGGGGAEADAEADLADRLDAALAGDLDALRRERAEGVAGTVDDVNEAPRRGQIIAVWGPIGSPGRTTVAVSLAAELASGGVETLLIDADTYGASVAQSLGLLDDTPGLAVAARAAEQGTLDAPGLLRRAAEVSPRLRVLTGLPRADRWPEVRDGAMGHILDLARLVAEVVIVDCGFSVEADEELSYDTSAPRRNGTTLTSLEAADQLVVVGSGDPVGLQRLVRAVGELGHIPSPPPRVVVNRVRASAAGPRPAAAVRDILARFSGLEDVAVIPDDRDACDAAMLAGRSLVEHAPGSRAREAIGQLARELVPGVLRPQGQRRGRLRR